MEYKGRLMEYKLLDFLFCDDASETMNQLAKEGWRFVTMTDTAGRGYILMEREKN